MARSKINHKLSRDEGGAIKALPKLLVILVVVAALSIVSIFVYLSLIETVDLHKIEVYIDGQKADPVETIEGNHSIYIVAKGDDGAKLKDVTVTLSGSGVNLVKKTDSNGKANFGTVNLAAVTDNNDQVQIEALYDQGDGSKPIVQPILVNPA